MAVPIKRRILWVDDEIDLLTPHRLLLERRGYEVDAIPNGDDALALLRQSTYDLVLLDEEMPGRRGLAVLDELRALDPLLRVVMVTKSEEDATLREAIGRQVQEYIVKPTSPRQVLSVVARLLEGAEMRHDLLAREFVQRFAELHPQVHPSLDWRGWTRLYSELVDWELQLTDADERGLLDSLGTLMEKVRREFTEFVIRHYRTWVTNLRGDRPPLSVDVVRDFVMPLARSGERACLVVVDCLRLDQWRALRERVAEDFEIEESLYCSILPTATPYARNAIFSGLFPDELARRRPEWWSGRTGAGIAPNAGLQDEASLNAFEAEMLAEQVAALSGGRTSARYERIFSAADGEAVLRRLPSLLDAPGVLALVFNFVDLITHGRGESPVLFEIARDAEALRRLTAAWYEGSSLREALRECARRNVPVLFTTDHGSVHCKRPATVFAKRDATANLRYKFGDDLRAESPSAVYLVTEMRDIRLPPGGLKTNCLIAREDYFFVYPTKLREYQARYRDNFLHGGISPEEMILPAALLTPRRARHP